MGKFSVLSLFLCFSLIVYSKTNDMFIVDTTSNIILYDITDCRLDLVCNQMPNTSDENVLFCAAAAFTGKRLDYFEHSNILGSHISKGVLYQGYEEDKDGIPFEERYALFVWQGFDNQGCMMRKGFYTIPNDEILSQTVEQGGMAFTQHWVIKNKQIFMPVIQPLTKVEYFRALCQKQQRFYIIANKQPISYNDFLNTLLDYGVENALYMDMGRGWNHSFYRDSFNQLHIIHPKMHSFCTNWMVVYRQ